MLSIACTSNFNSKPTQIEGSNTISSRMERKNSNGIIHTNTDTNQTTHTHRHTGFGRRVVQLTNKQYENRSSTHLRIELRKENTTTTTTATATKIRIVKNTSIFDA